jgi:hypothetical protein
MRPASAFLIVCALLGCGRSADQPAAAPPEIVAPQGDAGSGPQSTDAGTPPDAGATEDAGTASDGGAPVDGGTGAAPCPPGFVPSSGVVAAPSSDPACDGIAPTAPVCEARIKPCQGTIDSGGGPMGNVASAGTADWNGSIALYCGKVDVGPSPGWDLWRWGGTAWARSGHLGDEAWPQPDGFIALTTSYAGDPPPIYDFVDGSGNRHASIPKGRGRMLISPLARIQIDLVASGSQFTAVSQAYDAAGAPQGRLTLGVAGSNPVVSGGVDVRGFALVLFGDYGKPATSARWIAPDGNPASEAFAVDRYPEELVAAAPLPGGGLILGPGGTSWTSFVRVGSTSIEAAPAWLTGRYLVRGLVRGARALAVVGSDAKLEVVRGDGTSCGTLDTTGIVTVGGDGTVFATDGDASYRVFPGLLR